MKQFLGPRIKIMTWPEFPNVTSTNSRMVPTGCHLACLVLKNMLLRNGKTQSKRSS